MSIKETRHKMKQPRPIGSLNQSNHTRAQLATKGVLGEVVTTCERSQVLVSPWGFSFKVGICRVLPHRCVDSRLAGTTFWDVLWNRITNYYSRLAGTTFWIMVSTMTTRNAGRRAATTRGGGISEHDGREGERFGDQVGSGRGSQGGGRDGQREWLRANGGGGGVLDFSTIIAQQLQNLLPTIVEQVGNHANNQGSNKNQDNNVVNDNNQGLCDIYTRWIEKIELVQDMSGYGENQKVKYTAGSLIGKALTWWNSHVQTRGQEAAVGMTWEDIKTLTREELCLNNEMQKLETEFWCHTMVGAGHAAYTNRFHDLARLVPHLVTPKNKRIERYIYGLAPQIRVMVAATEPTTIQSVVLKAGMLTDETIRNGALKKVTKKRGNSGEPSRDGNVRDDNKSSRTGRVFATITNPVRKGYTSVAPKCPNCNYHH
ncbi:reverse transcriptase domain-containing protein [Tanacetum coccineum]